MQRELFLNGKKVSENSDYDEVSYSAGQLMCKQSELTHEEFFKVIDTLKEDVKDGLNKLKEFDFLNLKFGQEKIISLLHISTGLESSLLKTFKVSEIKIMINDFFFLNPEVKTGLENMCQIAALGMMTNSYKSLEESLRNLPLHLSKGLSKTPSSRSLRKTLQKSKLRKI